MKYLVIIPARSGSKGVPNKNKKILGQKPLIQYTIEAALEVFNPEEICVSTDDIDIFEIASKMGIKPPFLRPDFLSNDSASSQDVLLHALDYYETKNYVPDAIVLLQVTSPFRSSKQIIEAKNLYDSKLDMVVSVFETKANPYFNLFEENDKGFLQKSKSSSYTRRQDCPLVYEFNGAIYIINPDSLKLKKVGEFSDIKKYEMDEMSSHDIDTPFDWILAEQLINLK